MIIDIVSRPSMEIVSNRKSYFVIDDKAEFLAAGILYWQQKLLTI